MVNHAEHRHVIVMCQGGGGSPLGSVRVVRRLTKCPRSSLQWLEKKREKLRKIKRKGQQEEGRGENKRLKE